MALPFLPEDEIGPMFERLSLQATTAPLKQFVNYVSETWIRSNTWPPSSWSVFMMATRSNNDVEGWHNGLHRRASGRWNMPFYLLIDLLHQEARLTALRIRLVSERKLKRIQRSKYRSLQAQVFNLWDDYYNQRKNAEQLLRQCAHLNGPKCSSSSRSEEGRRPSERSKVYKFVSSHKTPCFPATFQPEIRSLPHPHRLV